MPIYTANKGQHAFSPSVSHRLSIRESLKGWWVTLDESCIYELDGEDQNDWNKLAGLSFNLFNNHQNSAMFGWRWNPDTEYFEINAYCHINGQVVMTGALLEVAANAEFAVWLEMDYKARTVTFHLYQSRSEGGYVKRTHQVKFPTLGFIQREIGAWFGGNNPAPRDMALWKDKIMYYGNDIAYHQPPS